MAEVKKAPPRAVAGLLAAGTVAAHMSPVVLIDRPIAAFDFDSTLVEHKRKGPDRTMTARFIALLLRNFNVVIFSNRRSKGDINPLLNYSLEIGVTAREKLPLSYFGSLANNRYRKPHRGMWELYIEHITGLGYSTHSRHFAASFMCGDAAGRPGDFAATDLTFAMNCGLQFITPEVLFGDGTVRRDMDSMGVDTRYNDDDLRQLTTIPVAHRSGSHLYDDIIQMLCGRFDRSSCRPVCVVLMGGQGSGKSTFTDALMNECREYFSETPTNIPSVLCRDRLSPSSFRRMLMVAFASSSNIIIDGTHATVASRAAVLDLAKARNYETIIAHVTTSKGLCRHLNSARCEMDTAKHASQIPDVAINTYWKRIQEPTDGESDSVIEIPFALSADAPREVTEYRY